uniref:AAA+ ATPase domain-containing protein n=1 Tax=Chaetoceros debilis TaxID=122233 RepID=A0A7S3VAG6_9STRA
MGIIQLITPLLLVLVLALVFLPPCSSFVDNVVNIRHTSTNVQSTHLPHSILAATKDFNADLNVGVGVDVDVDADADDINLKKDINTSANENTIAKTSNIYRNNQAYLYQYATHWEQLLQQEHQQKVENLKLRRKTWSKAHLEASGMSIFHASAEPDSEVFGEKIIRVFRRMTMTRTRGKGNKSSGSGSSNNGGEGSSSSSSSGSNTWRDKFTRGDMLVMTSTPTAASSFGSFERSGRSRYGQRGNEPSVVPREGLVIDVGADWLTLGVGPTWPLGLWEARKDPGAFVVRLDRAAPRAPLKAQSTSLERLRKGLAGGAAESLARTFHSKRSSGNNGDGGDGDDASRMQQQVVRDYVAATGQLPPRFVSPSSAIEEFELESGLDSDFSTSDDENTYANANANAKKTSSFSLEQQIRDAIENTTDGIDFDPNQSQIDAIAWALQRQVSLICGPPGTGKTRVAALLIKTALKLKRRDEDVNNESSNDADYNDDDKSKQKQSMINSPRVLAVTHSNGAADVLLEALLKFGVPAVRIGRPASVSPNVQHRTVVAIAEKMPELIKLRQRASDTSLDRHERSAAAFDMKQYMTDIQEAIVKTAPVVVTSCIGANQLLAGNAEDGGSRNFPLVVLDEAAQTTEPALVCALSAARAEQLILIGDTKQLPPTITAMDLRGTLGVSPMARLEKIGVGEITLQVQYRMPPALIDHPSKYFYDGKVKCANLQDSNVGVVHVPPPPPAGFKWPTSDPLAFVNIGNDSEITHNFGGKSNPTEVELVVRIVSDLLEAGEVEAKNISIISPYSKQVQLIRSELSDIARKSSKSHDIKVGTVDSFQGYETDVVIFSAVRSNQLNEMGFLRDPRRLCVAITRARKGLILVGDQKVLRSCRHWAALLDSCNERGCTLDETDFVDKEEQRLLELAAEVSTNSDAASASIGSLMDAEDGLFELFN